MAEPGAVEIVALQDRPEAIPVCARWAFETWGGEPVADAAAAAALWRRQVAAAGLPLRWAALDGGDVLGMASLLAEDLPARADLSPWLGDGFVAPEARGRGIASTLVRHVEAQAAARGTARLYLFTDTAAGLYAGLGWRRIAESRDPRGAEVSVMAKDLSARAG